MAPEEATRRARRDFGGLLREKERARDAWGVGLVRDLTSDVRQALRSLRRSPAFALVAAVSLAVGIGVNGSLFAVVHAIWLAPVPGVAGQDRIAELVPVVRGHEEWLWTYPDFESLADAETPFEFLAAWAERGVAVGREDDGRRARVAYATSGYFRVLGALPSVGRGFLASEDGGPGQHPVVVVSRDFWRERLSASPDVLGSSVLLDGVPYTVVGVAPEEFSGARPLSGGIDLWVPLFQHPEAGGEEPVFGSRERGSVQVLGRLRPGATMSEARVAVRTVFDRLATAYPETNRDRTAKAAGFGRFPAQNRIGDLAGVVGLCGLFAVLLLIICANLAGLALARAAAREHEIGVRLALGSSRVRLVRHLMVESGILAVCGGGVGTVLAGVLMTRISPLDLAISAPGAAFEPSWWTAALSVALSFAAVLVFGLVPALRFSRPELVSVLKDDAGGGGRRVGRVHRYAAASQTGTALLLLLLGVLFLRSVGRADERLGEFRPEGLAVADFSNGGMFLGLLDVADEGLPSMEEGGTALVDRILESVGSLPGVSSAALADGLPLDRRRSYLLVIPAEEAGPEGTGVRVDRTLVTEGYFSAIGTPVLRGRGILRTDDPAAPRVAVITRSLADRLWPGEDALGRRFSQAGAEHASTWTVVGVVGHVPSSSVTEELPQVFLPLRQAAQPGFTVLVRSRSDPTALAGPVREAMRSVDAGLPPWLLVPGPSLVARATQEQRASGRVSAMLGLLILVLSAMGVHGIVSLAVTCRTRELAVRMALGATRGTVVRGVLRDSLRMSWPGLVAGGVLATGTAAAMRSMLLGLSPVDPVSLLSVGGLLLCVVLVSSLGPAVRASRIQPMEALRRG